MSNCVLWLFSAMNFRMRKYHENAVITEFTEGSRDLEIDRKSLLFFIA